MAELETWSPHSPPLSGKQAGALYVHPTYLWSLLTEARPWQDGHSSFSYECNVNYICKSNRRGKIMGKWDVRVSRITWTGLSYIFDDCEFLLIYHSSWESCWFWHIVKCVNLLKMRYIPICACAQWSLLLTIWTVQQSFKLLQSMIVLTWQIISLWKLERHKSYHQFDYKFHYLNTEM